MSNIIVRSFCPFPAIFLYYTTSHLFFQVFCLKETFCGERPQALAMYPKIDGQPATWVITGLLLLLFHLSNYKAYIYADIV